MMKYIKADKETIKRITDANEQSFGNSTQGWWYKERQRSYWQCNKCGWEISYTDDCVITSSHDFWQNNPTHMDASGGIYHTWCRELCQHCGGRIGKDGHTQCDEEIERQETEKRIESADDEMFNNLLEVK